MQRRSTYEVPVDTGLFSPVGLQPAAVCRLGFNAAGRWLSTNVISHRSLVSEHRTGFVLWSARLLFEEPVSFFDSDCLEMTIGGRVRGGGTQFESEIELSGASRLVARLQACCVPLRLDGDPALSGAPARLNPEVLARFQPEEIEARPHRSPVPGLRKSVAAEGVGLARGRTPFVIHRHQCEVADQWFWPEAVSLAAAGREDVVRTEAGSVPALRPALGTPMRRLDVLFSRPFFLFDEGVAQSTAFDWQGRLVFVHELSGTGEERPRAVVIEQFAAAEGLQCS